MEKPEDSPTEGDHLLTLFHANTRSIKGKTAELQFLSAEADIICLTETHLDETITNNSILASENRSMFRRDRNIYGGGVLIAVNETLKPKEVDLTAYKEEVIAVQIQSRIIICCYYRPHVSLQNTDTIDGFLEYLETCFPRYNILFVGDMNFPDIIWDKGKGKIKTTSNFKYIHQDFLNVLHRHNMEQIITAPTHILGNTLDLVCTNNPAYIHSTEVISPGLSDHYLILVQLQQQVKVFPSLTKKIRLYKRADEIAFSEQLQKTREELGEMSDPELMWNLFAERLAENISQHVPTKEIKSRHASIPEWFNKRAKKLRSKERKAYNKAKRTFNDFDAEVYRKTRRESKKELKTIRQLYYVNRIYQPLKKGNSKPFFKLLNLGKTKKISCIAIKDEHGALTDDPENCAELLNSFFSRQFQDGFSAMDFQSVENGTECPEISANGIAKLILDLPNGKSPGPDGIRKPDMLVDLATTAECLALIFSASLNSGILPKQWKHANVTPIYKGGDTESTNNYRPISLTSIPCKLMEHIVLHHLNETLDNHLHYRQHGFRRGLSCQTQLCSTFNDLAKSVNDGHTTHALVMDFKKAFDKVPHLLLLQKLQNIPGLDGYLLNWIKDFLSDRQQTVVLNGVSSLSCNVKSGVPQGSVLGPILFLCYINDIVDNLSCDVSLYADDTLLFQHVDNPADALRFQNNINAVHEWSEVWKMPFNIKKCQAICFGKTPTRTSYTLGNSPLEWTDCIKYLGVIIQSDLKFNTHITEKCSKANKILGGIKYLTYGAPMEAKLLAYTSLCRPILEYADVVWDPHAKQTIHKIELIQNKAIRFIKNIKGRDESVSTARDDLDLISLEKRRRNHRLSLLIRILEDEDRHKTLSKAYDELIQDRKYETRAASRGEPNSIITNLNIYHQSFLPRTIRDIRGTQAHSNNPKQ